jgi:hypothetical protein
MLRTIGDSGINWNWYLCAEFNEEAKTVHIFYYDRWHKYEFDSKHPKAEWLKNDRIDFIEDARRIVLAVKIEGVEYRVTNPQQIFTYNDMTHYVPE